MKEELRDILTGILREILKYQLPDGRFRDILDDGNSFVDGTSAMMVSAVIYRGNIHGFTDFGIDEADRAFTTVTEKIDEYGLIHEVAGCPDFIDEGTSAEAQAAYIMAAAWKEKYENV